MLYKSKFYYGYTVEIQYMFDEISWKEIDREYE
jgi:hypothetical protein